VFIYDYKILSIIIFYHVPNQPNSIEEAKMMEIMVMTDPYMIYQKD